MCNAKKVEGEHNSRSPDKTNEQQIQDKPKEVLIYDAAHQDTLYWGPLLEMVLKRG